MDLKQKIVEAVSGSICEVLKATFSLSASIKKIENRDKTNGEEIVASIGLSGPLSASLVLVLPVKSALWVVSKMIGDEIKEVTQDVVDGTGELVNMIAGCLKKHLEGSFSCALGLPAVIVGADPLSIAKLCRTENLSLDVQSQEVSFQVYFSYAIPEPGMDQQDAAGEGIPESSGKEVADVLRNFLKNKNNNKGNS